MPLLRDWTQRLPLVTQDVAAHVEAILDRAFLRLLVLIVVAIAAALLAALAYRAANNPHATAECLRRIGESGRRSQRT